MKKIDSLLELIAQQHLGIKTLETRNSGSLDFYDVEVGRIKNTLSAAYIAGQHEAREEIIEMLGLTTYRSCAGSFQSEQAARFINEGQIWRGQTNTYAVVKGIT